ncbi:hypothetical protein GTP27_18735 [Pseudoduganella sp. CY13W]|uniref:Tetratricopeptide repeat protein n=2 Tax=Duganella qianjiadongensis TaxID=2692176 RepID=A0ABW9VSJ7_9BURK|nr:hypothetical protein [Duganella qianjiadongensis]
MLSTSVFAAEPTIHEVYLVVEAGKFAEAETMMNQVLQAHPSSATAHFVLAELLAKQDKFLASQQALNKAEELAPGLSKVDPQALAKLKRLLASATDHGNRDVGLSSAQSQRKQFVNGCVSRAIQRNEDAASAASFCSCSFDVLANELSHAEFMEFERTIADQRNPEVLPAIARARPKLEQCKK